MDVTHLRGAVNTATSVLEYGRWAFGVAAAVVYQMAGESAGLAALPSHGTAIAAFAAFGTMSGLALSAFGIITAGSASPMIKAKLETTAGAMVLRHVLASAVLWLVCAAVMLATLLIRAHLLAVSAVGLTAFAISQNFLAMLALTALWIDQMRSA